MDKHNSVKEDNASQSETEINSMGRVYSIILSKRTWTITVLGHSFDIEGRNINISKHVNSQLCYYILYTIVRHTMSSLMFDIHVSHFDQLSSKTPYCLLNLNIILFIV